MTEAITISQLCIYPVKSLGGFTAEQWLLTPEGLAHDRRWMIIDENNQFVSQRKYPQMCKVSARLVISSQKGINSQKVSHSHKAVYDDTAPLLELAAEHATPIRLSASDCRQPISATVWKTPCEAYCAPGEVNAWLNKALGTNGLRLVTIDPCFRRALDIQRFGQHTTAFADGAPLLLANQASLDKLNQALNSSGSLSPLAMARFRPNIVIEGLDAFLEHAYDQVHLGKPAAAQSHSIVQKKPILMLVDHCQRCSIITIDPKTGITIDPKTGITCDPKTGAKTDSTAAPNDYAKTLFSVLAGLNPMPGKPKAPAFGVNCVAMQEHNVLLSVGDRIFVD